MRVLIAERHSDPVVAVLLFYRVGSRNETERDAGVSHFLEHMMFKGSKRYGKGEVDRVTTLLGGNNNAFTGNDHTAYWFEFASDRWEQALAIEADRMRKLSLDPEEFDAERAVVLEELAQSEDDPWRVLTRRVESALFPRHPYGRPVIGYMDSLRAMSVADMRDYYRRFYHPGNATLVICGDVRHSAALRAARKHFAGIPAGKAYAEADCFRPAVSQPVGEVRLAMRWDDQAKRLCMAWPTTSVGSDDDYALDLIMTALLSGRTSRLQRRLVLEERLATSLSASNDTRVEGGVFWLFADCAQGVEPERLEAAIDEELEKLATRPLSAAELKRARALLNSSEAYDGETVSDLAEELGEWAVDADWRLAFDGGVRYAALTGAELRDTAARYLLPERRVVGWCLPTQAAPRARPPRAKKRKDSPPKRRSTKKAAR
ncbi:MAG: pitrilysin family protein [Planctomycetota bacterium]|nr:pitrilysin family protein [Planctomycetota bacterium]